MVDGLYHYLGIKYENKKEVVKWHQTRMCRDDLHANQILNSLVNITSGLSCISMLTDEEYKEWKLDRGYDPDKKKTGNWRNKT